MRINLKDLILDISFDSKKIFILEKFLRRFLLLLIITVLTGISIVNFLYFYKSGLSLAYNDARSHLDIARRVVEGLKVGLAQLGSVWLPLLHILMLPTIWNDFFWHSGASGAIISIFSFILTGVLVYKFLEKLGVGTFGRIFGVFIFSANLNILYLSSTAMTEMLLLVTMTAGVYYLAVWARKSRLVDLLRSAFWIMLSTLVRYDGWFLFVFATLLIGVIKIRKKGPKETEGHLILFMSLAGFGIFLWFLWNLVIFKDPLYFVFGPYSARAQQMQLEAAGELPTKGNLILSLKAYLFALLYNSYTIPALAGFVGLLKMWFDMKINLSVRIATLALLSSFFFNVIALYLGHSVLFLPEIIGKTWFNVRYGMMLVPSIAIGLGYLVDKSKSYRFVLVGISLVVILFAFISRDAATIDDAIYGASQKNVTEVSNWLRENASQKEGFILISAASHDAIIFSSGLPMKRFIHEGTGKYWEDATTSPDRWARWIVMRTYDDDDLTWKLVSKSSGLAKYNLVDHYPFADIYELDQKYLSQ